MSHPQWAGDVGERVIWMQRTELKTAHLRLDPPQLGTIEVHILLREADTEVWFSAPSAPVREALESALPRLREMLSQHGLQLGQAGVFEGGNRGDSSAFRQSDRSPEQPRRIDAAQQRVVTLDRPRHGGLFEAYA
jgi:flagellar hook-length control protein FliK